MNGVIGIIDLLSATNLDSYQEELLEIVKNSSDKLLKILNDILDISKIEAGKFELQNKPFSLSKLVKEIKSVFGSIVMQKSIDFKILIDSDLPKEVDGDETRLFQILSNVVINAVKFTDEGEVILNCYRNKKKDLVFEVKDSGIGIPEDKLSRIFDEFNQAENSETNDIKGTGLGLSISKSLVELMGGRIHVESELNKGTTFKITIPLKTSNRKLADNYEKEKDIKFDGRVLVVEDNKTNQKVLGLMLNKINVQFDFANNGKEALEMFDGSTYDLILMDINMPVMNGDECVSILREKGVQTKIVALTGNAMKQEIETYLSKGFDDYMTKPLKFSVLKSLFS